MSQERAVEKLGMNQNAISRLENPYYGKATLTTLKRIASAYDVGLLVEFVPFSRLIDRANGTPHFDPGLSPETMQAPNFEAELPELDWQENASENPVEAAHWQDIVRDISGTSAPSGEALNTAAPSASGSLLPNTEQVSSPAAAATTKGAYTKIILGVTIYGSRNTEGRYDRTVVPSMFCMHDKPSVSRRRGLKRGQHARTI
jgi:transcriptional regulator with XRE-family HTH domain